MLRFYELRYRSVESISSVLYFFVKSLIQFAHQTVYIMPEFRFQSVVLKSSGIFLKLVEANDSFF